MTFKIRHIITCVATTFIVLSSVGCIGKVKSADTTSESTDERSYRYCPPQPPAVISTDQGIESFYREHFWDNLNPADSVATDTTSLIEAFVWYINLMYGKDTLYTDDIEKLFRKSETVPEKFNLLSVLAENVLHEPNSPYRDDELYIPVLRVRIESELCDYATRTRDEYTLRMSMQNRIGHKANDFSYCLADGSIGTLYGLDAEYTLIFINNPGCEMCRSISSELRASPTVEAMVSDGRLKVLAIYPDEDLEDWYKYYDEMPAEWLNGYDKGSTIRKAGSYKLNAIPALYLLDSEKRVLVKDGTDVPAIETLLLSSSNKK